MSKEVLENYYKQLIKQKERETFLSRFNDYIEYLERNSECKRIIADIENQKDELFKEKERLKNIVTEEIKKSKTAESEVKEILEKYGTKIPNKKSNQSSYIEGLLNSLSAICVSAMDLSILRRPQLKKLNYNGAMMSRSINLLAGMILSLRMEKNYSFSKLTFIVVEVPN